MVDEKIEQFLRDAIIPDLEKGRPNFDAPHTLEVVSWIKKIMAEHPELNLDQDALIIAAYAHDWGYSGLFEGKDRLNSAEVTSMKPLHMEIGAKKTEKLLKNEIFSFLSDKQKERIVHLVFMHDKIHDLTETDELVLAEADILSGLDVESLKPTFDHESNVKFMESVARRRIPRFITDFSKKEVERLFKLRLEYYEKNK
jgi:hypothetical protein